MNSLIKTENLNVGYNGRVVISDVQLKAMKGQVICLLGPNGAGKSTILRTLSGLLAPVDGTVYVEGQDIRSIKKKDIAQKMSLVLTDQVKPTLMTVYSLVSMGRAPYTNFLGRLSEEDHAIIASAMKTVGVEHLANRYYTELSDGEKQKVMIARALVQEPELIVLDEPTSHLDIRHKVEVVRILQLLANEKGITCILSLHDIDLAIKGCQTVLLVSGGKIAAMGMPEEIIRDGMLQSLYGIHGAVYNELLGAVELRGGERNDVFIAAGCGTGIKLYRALARRGLGITSGVLHRDDIDYAVAKTVCQTAVSENAFEPISEENFQKAQSLMQESKAVVDSGFPVGTINQKNAALLRQAVETGEKVYSLRAPAELSEVYGQSANKVISVSTISQLVDRLTEGLA